MGDFRWIPRSSVNTSVYGCAICQVPLCFYDAVKVHHTSYVCLDPLHVANLSRLAEDRGDAFCAEGHCVGRLYGNTLYLYRPIRINIAGRVNGGADPAVVQEWAFIPRNYRFPIWCCICCQRPIGSGYGFAYHFAPPVSFVNVRESSADPSEIRCLCGCYVGYRFQYAILVGEIDEFELTS